MKLLVTGALGVSPETANLSVVALYDVAMDPSETTNRADEHSELVDTMLAELRVQAARAVPPRGGAIDRKPADFRVPAVWGPTE